MTTERWTDEMVDGLASSVRELREESRASARELRESIRELRDDVDGIRLTTQALLQLSLIHI